MVERWERVRAMGSPVGYLYRTAFNLNRKRLRRLGVVAARAVTQLARSGDPAEVVEERTEVAQLLSTLPQTQREVLVLVEGLGFTYDEVARICRVSPGTARVRLSRAKARIRALTGEVG